MKKKYVKPCLEVIKVINQRIMMSNSEPEVTYNIGANSHSFDVEDDDDLNQNNGLWNDENDD